MALPATPPRPAALELGDPQPTAAAASPVRLETCLEGGERYVSLICDLSGEARETSPKFGQPRNFGCRCWASYTCCACGSCCLAVIVLQLLLLVLFPAVAGTAFPNLPVQGLIPLPWLASHIRNPAWGDEMGVAINGDRCTDPSSGSSCSTMCYDAPVKYLEECIVTGINKPAQHALFPNPKIIRGTTCRELGMFTTLGLCPDQWYGDSGACLYMSDIPAGIRDTINVFSDPESLWNVVMGWGALWRAHNPRCAR